MTQRERLREQQREIQHEQAAMGSAQAAAQQKIQQRLENPEFFQQLRDADADSEQFPWLESELGPLFSGAHIIGYRSQDYERQIKWLDRNKSERVIAEHDPGRLCKGVTRQIAQKVHRRSDKDSRDEMTVDERRAVRQAHDVATTLKSLSIDSKGLDSVTRATAVSKVEKNESEESVRERAGRFLG